MKKIILLISLFLITRVLIFNKIPVFEDETFYTQWSLQILKNPSEVLKPISLGFAPLFPVLTALVKPFVNNQIIAGRIVSLISGGTILFVVYYIITHLSKAKYSLLVSIVFLLLPISLTYDSLALLDTSMVLFTFLSLLFAYFFITKSENKWIFLYMFFLVLALLTKQIALLVPPAVIFYVIINQRKKIKELSILLLSSTACVLIVGVIYFVFRKETISLFSDFIFIPNSLEGLTFQIKKNSWLTWHWLTSYYSKPLLLISFAGFIAGFVRNNKQTRFWTITFFAIFLSMLTFNNLYFPRHTLVFAPFFVIFIAFFINIISAKSKVIALIIVFALIANTTTLSLEMTNNPEDNSVMAKEDKFQLYEDWTSGKILEEIAQYLDKEAQSSENISVITEEGTTLYSLGLPIFLKNKQNIKIKNLSIEDEYIASLNNKEPVYLIFNKHSINKIDNSRIESVEKFNISLRHDVYIAKIKKY